MELGVGNPSEPSRPRGAHGVRRRAELVGAILYDLSPGGEVQRTRRVNIKSLASPHSEEEQPLDAHRIGAASVLLPEP